jgi:hypothetical protein
MWVDFMEALLLDCNSLRCDVDPQFFVYYARDICLEVHVGDLRGAGTERALASLREELDEVV